MSLLEILEHEIADLTQRKKDLHPVHHAEAQLALSIGLSALRRVKRALKGPLMKEYIVQTGESVDECARRHGLRCLTRRERVAGEIEPTAMITVLGEGSYEAVGTAPKDD